jgi:ketosteroid isomerase-like protein
MDPMNNLSPASDADSTVPVATETIEAWVTAYLRAWKNNAPSDIRALFTEDASYHESPYETEWVGCEQIVNGWRSRWDWQKGGWEFDWAVASATGQTVVITGIGRYKELGDFDNVWTLTFTESARVSRFDMLNTERM